MSRLKFTLLFAAVIAIPLFAAENIYVSDLTCQYKTNPLGVEERNPVLSWKLESIVQGQKQTGYQILVASSPDRLNDNEADIWNTGKVNSEQSVAVTYKGRLLSSRQKCYWKVKVWDKDGEPSAYSETGVWEMALLSANDWEARWLRHPDFLDNKHDAKPAPFFRNTFSADKEIVSARAYVTGLGYFQMYLNGKKVGDHVLDPVKTRYDKDVKYLVFDIKEYLKQGENAVGMVLGTGWYNHFAIAAWLFNQAPWRDYPTMLCQLEITYSDGTTQTVISDGSWKCSQGPIVFDGIRNGEYYDARLEMPGWSEPWFDDSDWQKAVEVKGPEGELMAQQLPPIKEMIEIKPVSITEIKPGVYVFDLGQNIAGYSRIKVAGPAGTEITLKHGERLFPDGSVEQKQILRFLRSGEAQTDKYILKGDGVEEWNPRFVYHGYQYVEVTGLPVKPTKETLTGIVVYTSFESAGQFQCSNPLFNQIQQNTRWSYVGNYHGIPTDCPTREKIGWTGDGHLVAEAGLYNYNTVTSYVKWLDDHVDEQRPDGDLPGIIPSSGWGYTYAGNGNRQLGYGPSWEGSMVLIPWYLYVYTGDTAMLERYYQPIKKFIDHLEKTSNDYLLEYGIDDHKAYYTKTDGAIINSSYFCYLTDIFVRMAEILDNINDVQKYTRLSLDIKDSFQQEYYDKEAKIFGNAGQTSLSNSIYMNLVPEEDREAVLKNLLARIDSADHHFDAGVGGVKALYEALSATNNTEILYQMVNQTDFPSYGYWVEMGANTLWQDWDASMSLNHIMFGSVSEWFFQSLAGINPDPLQPGFKHIILKPDFIQDLEWAAASHESMYGKITSDWERKDGTVILRVEIPVNSTATFLVPDGYNIMNAGGLDVESSQVKIPSGAYKLEMEQL